MPSSDSSTTPVATPAKGRQGFFGRLYNGTAGFDIVGKRKRFYAFFAVLVLVCLGSMVFRNFNYSIEFTGGTQIQMPAHSVSGQLIATTDVTDAYTQSMGKGPSSVQSVGTGKNETIQVRSDTLTAEQADKVETALFTKFQPVDSTGKASRSVISDSAVSASWGGEISQQAVIALAVFLVLVTLFMAFYFERWMAVAGLVALAHDVLVTAGIYSLVGFQVSPATVVGLLTILGFSLYDTVVVFDKVRENTRGLLRLTRRTYPESANLALNQTLMRSINTSLIALLPVLGLLVVGVGVLGVGTLADLALVQLVGMLSGALSSIFLATPLLVDLKMTEKPYKQQAARVLARRSAQARKAAQPAGEGVDSGTGDDEDLDEELRREQAYAAASTVPSRTPKAADARRGSGRPSARPTGKRRR